MKFKIAIVKKFIIRTPIKNKSMHTKYNLLILKSLKCIWTKNYSRREAPPPNIATYKLLLSSVLQMSG